ncbi:hypothetical protein PUR34_33445 [Streptomyces sp. JV185]|uniref:hypothetical protein n=1 Tax=Streptomyces sp. JV185 TaxID=858638 RepID=UPI002E7862D1|nr:hypothetical protein [Streptomyces sp. JV185]MEE1772933.1 hypothetical protein [Streptomyces sp. JV185]
MMRKTLAAAVAALALAGLAGTTPAGAVPGTVSGDGGNRIGTLRVNGDAYVKEGGLSATWVKESDKVKQIALSGNRIGVLKGDGDARVKEGGLSATWVLEAGDVTELALS